LNPFGSTLLQRLDFVQRFGGGLLFESPNNDLSVFQDSFFQKPKIIYGVQTDAPSSQKH